MPQIERHTFVMKGTEHLEAKRLDPTIYRPVFKSRTGLKKFKKTECLQVYI